MVDTVNDPCDIGSASTTSSADDGSYPSTPGNDDFKLDSSALVEAIRCLVGAEPVEAEAISAYACRVTMRAVRVLLEPGGDGDDSIHNTQTHYEQPNDEAATIDAANEEVKLGGSMDACAQYISRMAALVPIPDSDEEVFSEDFVLDGSGEDLGSTVPDPYLALEHLYVHSSISALMVECNALRAGVNYCSNLDLSDTIWPVYLNAHIDHLIKPARSLIDMRHRIQVPKPSYAILSLIARKWRGGRGVPAASIPVSTLEELQFLCNEVDDFIEQYVECPLVAQDRFDTVAQILLSTDASLRDTCSEGDSVQVNRQYNEAFDRSFRFVWGRAVSLTVLATALYCPET